MGTKFEKVEIEVVEFTCDEMVLTANSHGNTETND